MANGWTLERRQRQSVLIRRWKPWLNSTGPKTPEGKATVAENSYRGAERQVCRRLARLLREQGDALERL